MAQWDSADLLARLKVALRRPGADLEATDPILYQLLGDAQLEVMTRVAMEAPELNYGAAQALTSSDGGKTYLTSSAAVEWIGPIEVYRDSTLKGPPLSAGALWECNKDYTVEGARTIRLTCGRAKSFSPFARFVLKPLLLDAGTAPVLAPASLRRCVVQLAGAMFCDRGGSRDPAPYLRAYERIYVTDVTAERSRQSAGLGPAGRWWSATGDLGRLG
jgi:hypothetical protein